METHLNDELLKAVRKAGHHKRLHEKMVQQTVDANPGPVGEYKAGKEKALNQLVGQVMKQSKGRANAAEVMRTCEATTHESGFSESIGIISAA